MHPKLDEATARLELARGAITRLLSLNASTDEAKAAKNLYDAVKLMHEYLTDLDRRLP